MTINFVKIELGISTEDAERYYLAYMKLVSLVDLFPIYNELGDFLPEFVQFYKSAKSYNITPYKNEKTSPQQAGLSYYTALTILRYITFQDLKAGCCFQFYVIDGFR